MLSVIAKLIAKPEKRLIEFFEIMKSFVMRIIYLSILFETNIEEVLTARYALQNFACEYIKT